MNYTQNRTLYALNVYRMLYSLIFNCQVIIHKIYSVSRSDIIREGGDFLATHGMVGYKFIDQAQPLLPAGPYNTTSRYYREAVREMFESTDHHMKLGETSKGIESNFKLYTEYACITDQYFSRCNELSLQDIESRKISDEVYLKQLSMLTFNSVSMNIKNIQQYRYSILPITKRDECHGTIILYMLSTERQQQYISHLMELMKSTNLLSFRNKEELSELSCISGLKDSNMLHYRH